MFRRVTVCRWVQAVHARIAAVLRRHLKPTNDSWRMDETYVPVRRTFIGRWIPASLVALAVALSQLHTGAVDVAGLELCLRHPLFRRRWFTDEVMITWVRWYLRFKPSRSFVNRHHDRMRYRFE